MPEWHIRDDNHGLPAFQFAVFHYQHSETGFWQFGITFDGDHLNWVTASQDPDRLYIWEQELQRQLPPGEPFQKSKALALLDEFYKQREADPLPLPHLVERMYLLNRMWGK